MTMKHGGTKSSSKRRRSDSSPASWLYSFRCMERSMVGFLMLFIVTTILMGLKLELEERALPLENWTPSVSSWKDPPSPDQAVAEPTQLSALYALKDPYPWTNHSNIPKWMQDYMDWHTYVVSTLNTGNWDRYNYVILRCYRADSVCGGVSDRLKPVPLVLLAAQRSNRILLIDWDRPYPLQEFLEPPKRGFQWSVPDFLSPHLHSKSQFLVTRASMLVSKCRDAINQTFVQTHIHDFHGGASQYDEAHGDGAFARLYHDLFRIFFQPADGVQHLIDQQMASHDLIPGDYSVAHYRAEYGKEVQRHAILRNPDFLTKVTINAIRCASELQPSSTRKHVPIYFASDNPLAMTVARQQAKKFQYPIVTFNRKESTPLKLDDFGNGTDPILPHQYYSTFVDLYIAGSGRCVTHGRGGFGRFASLLSYNASCSSTHVKQFFPLICQGRPPFDILQDEGKGNDTHRW